MVLTPLFCVKGRFSKKDKKDTKKRWIVTNSCGIVCSAERRKNGKETLAKGGRNAYHGNNPEDSSKG